MHNVPENENENEWGEGDDASNSELNWSDDETAENNENRCSDENVRDYRDYPDSAARSATITDMLDLDLFFLNWMPLIQMKDFVTCFSVSKLWRERLDGQKQWKYLTVRKFQIANPLLLPSLRLTTGLADADDQWKRIYKVALQTKQAMQTFAVEKFHGIIKYLIHLDGVGSSSDLFSNQQYYALIDHKWLVNWKNFVGYEVTKHWVTNWSKFACWTIIDKESNPMNFASEPGVIDTYPIIYHLQEAKNPSRMVVKKVVAPFASSATSLSTTSTNPVPIDRDATSSTSVTNTSVKFARIPIKLACWFLRHYGGSGVVLVGDHVVHTEDQNLRLAEKFPHKHKFSIWSFYECTDFVRHFPDLI